MQGHQFLLLLFFFKWLDNSRIRRREKAILLAPCWSATRPHSLPCSPSCRGGGRQGGRWGLFPRFTSEALWVLTQCTQCGKQVATCWGRTGWQNPLMAVKHLPFLRNTSLPGSPRPYWLFFFFWPHDLRDLSSPAKDWIQGHGSESAES